MLTPSTEQGVAEAVNPPVTMPGLHERGRLAEEDAMDGLPLTSRRRRRPGFPVVLVTLWTGVFVLSFSAAQLLG
jgi:hypothetical protein